MPEVVPEPPIYFNSKQQEWSVGEGSYQALIDSLAEGESAQDIYNVRDVLTGSFELDRPREPVTRRFDRDDLLETGGYILDLIYPLPMRRRVIERGYKAGLTVGDDAYASRHTFGAFENFQNALGEDTEAGKRIGAFDHWTLADHVENIRDLALELQRKPRHPDVLARAVASKGTKNPKPSPRVIAQKITLRELYELAGFPYFQKFDREDYKLWGALYRMANNDAPISSGLKYLSPIGRGPSTRSVANNFDSLLAFVDESQKTYEELIRLIKPPAKKLEEMEEALACGELPSDLMQDAKSDQERLGRYSRYLVLKRFEDRLGLDRVTELALLDNADSLTIAVKEADRSINPWALQKEALSQGIFFDIWPKRYLDNLKVPLTIRLKGERFRGVAVLYQIILPNGEVVRKMHEPRPGLGFPPNFIRSIEKLEQRLKNPPPHDQMLKEIGWWNGSNGTQN